MSVHTDKKVIVIGGGPAGLTAAFSLSQRGVKSVVLEKDDVVGGLSRTVHYNGYHFDIGGHRFYTKVKAVEDMWRSVLGDDLLRRNRISRIYYDGKFFNYPIRPFNALLGLGFWNSILIRKRCGGCHAVRSRRSGLPRGLKDCRSFRPLNPLSTPFFIVFSYLILLYLRDNT